MNRRSFAPHSVPKPKRPTFAFTLIELVVVMVILGIIASIAVLSLGSTTDRYQLSQATRTFQLFDARARREARSLRRTIETTIEKQQGRLIIDRPARKFRLPSSVEIGKVRMGRVSTRLSSVEINYSREGTSPTYAVEFRRGKLTQWLVVLGRSGQVITLDQEGEVNALLSI
ncbi:MAG: Tfp pilus assembly protein FimT/FimU [Rubripirellula sp.]